MSDVADSFRSHSSRFKAYLDKTFAMAAQAVVRARLMSSNADTVIEAAIRKEVEADAKGIVPAVSRRIEDQIMDLSRDEIRKDVERRLGHQPLDVIIRNAIDDVLDKQVAPLVQRAISETDRILATRVNDVINARVDHHLGSTIMHVITKVIGPERLKEEYLKAVREVAIEQAGVDTNSAALNPVATTTRTDRHFQFKKILGMVRPGKSQDGKVVPGSKVLMVGPAGSGKSLIAEHIAVELKLPYYFNGPLQSEYKLTGYKDATGQYHATPFRKAFEHGGVYLFDEIDACSAQALVAFNTALANGICDFPDRLVHQHPDFICLAAANTHGQGGTTTYAGRERIDGATLDRFGVVDIAYDADMERRLANDPDWVGYVLRIRELARESHPRLIVSMRASIEGAKQLARGSTQKEVEDMFIWRGQIGRQQIEELRRQAHGEV
jgi:hypothetical protein